MNNQTAAIPKPRSEKRRRKICIKVRVTKEEKDNIKANAKSHRSATADFLRRLGLGMVPQSKLDQLHVRELLGVAGDLGRLGGLLKLYLSEKRAEDSPDALSRREIESLIREIRATSEVLKGKAANL